MAVGFAVLAARDVNPALMVHGSRLMVNDPHRVQGDDWFIVNGSKFMVIHYGREKDLL